MNGCGCDVDVVESGASAADQTQFWGCIQHFGRHFCFRTDDQSLVILDKIQ